MSLPFFRLEVPLSISTARLISQCVEFTPNDRATGYWFGLLGKFYYSMLLDKYGTGSGSDRVSRIKHNCVICKQDWSANHHPVATAPSSVLV